MDEKTLAILSCPMQENDAHAHTVGEYLIFLARIMWVDNEGADGKRPFGNSGWEGEIERALITAELVHGVLDEDGYVDECDWTEVRDVVTDALDELSQMWNPSDKQNPGGVAEKLGWG